MHIKNNLYRKNLNNAIKERNNDIRKLSAEHDTNKARLKQTTAWITYKLIIYSIDNAQSKINTVTSARHQKKHDALVVNRRITDGMKKNLITKLTRFELTDDEVKVLNFGLKHGVLSRPKESEMVATMEYVWEQIDNKNILKQNHMSKQRVQTALRPSTT